MGWEAKQVPGELMMGTSRHKPNAKRAAGSGGAVLHDPLGLSKTEADDEDDS
jgi:hypothetical protein